MSKTPAEIRNDVLALCQAFAAASLTQNAIVINAVATDIEMVRLPRLIPDEQPKPTLDSILSTR